MLSKDKKKKLRGVLAKINPDKKGEILVDELREELEEVAKKIPKDNSPEIESLKDDITELKSSLLSKIDKLTTKESLEDFKKQYLSSLSTLEEKLKLLILSAESDIAGNKEYLVNLDKELKELKLRTLALGSHGGGNMNRQIKVNGVDVLKRYTDINWVAGTNTTLTAVVDDVNKRENITISSAGGGGGTPGGNRYDVQINNPLGTFGGDDSFKYNPTTGIVDIGNTLIVNSSDSGTGDIFSVHNLFGNSALKVTISGSGNQGAVSTALNTLDDGNGGAVIAGPLNVATIQLVTSITSDDNDLTVHATNSGMLNAYGDTGTNIGGGGVTAITSAGNTTIDPGGDFVVNSSAGNIDLVAGGNITLESSSGGTVTLGGSNISNIYLGTANLVDKSNSQGNANDILVSGGNGTGDGNYFKSALTLGLTQVVGNDRKTGLTAAQALATYTVGASDGTFRISANVKPTTSTLHNFTVIVSYTDESNVARTSTLPFAVLAGTFVTAITNAGGTVPYEGIPIHIRAKAATTIIVSTTGTFTTVTYNFEERIELL